MKKSRVLINTLAALSVGLALFAISRAGKSGLVTAQNDSSADDEKLTQDALYRRDIHACGRVSTRGGSTNSNPREGCILSVLESADLPESICEDPLVKENLATGTCYQVMAPKQGTGAACEHLQGDQHDSCLTDVARAKKEPTFCKKILQTAYKDDCLDTLAKVANDRKICLEIEVPARRGGCIGQFLSSKEDEKICAQMSGLEADNCYLKYMGRGPIDLEFCNKHVSSFARPSCILSASKRQNDPKLCLQIDKADARIDCLSRLSIGKNDMSLCGQLDSPQERDGCYLKTLEITQTGGEGAKFCKRFSAENLKISCIKNYFKECMRYADDKDAFENCIQYNSHSK